jgi:CysZ protein
MGGILTGPIAIVRALGLLATRPRLVALALVPALVTFAISLVAVGLAAAYSHPLFAWLVREPSAGPLHTLWNLGWVAALIATVVLVLVATPFLVMLIAFPLCDPLVARVDGSESGEAGGVGAVLDSVRGTLLILLVGLAGSVAFFVLGFVPGVGLVTTPFVAFVWTPLFVAFDLLDSPLGRRGLRFGDKVRVLWRNLPAALSLGLVASPLVSVPFLNLIGLPLAVVAGVLAAQSMERGGRVATARA